VGVISLDVQACKQGHPLHHRGEFRPASMSTPITGFESRDNLRGDVMKMDPELLKPHYCIETKSAWYYIDKRYLTVFVEPHKETIKIQIDTKNLRQLLDKLS